MTRLILTSLTIMLASPLAPGAEPPSNEDARAAFFRKRIEPILATRCLECHGSDRKGGLDLLTRKAALAVLSPGKPAESLLLQYVQSGKMPPKKPLQDEEVSAIEQWIRAGAWFPDGELDPYAFSSEHRAGYDWWSLQPVRQPQPPQVKQVHMLHHDIDRFVLARLESNGLSFAPPADRATYIRRVTYDLVGLLPTYEEVQNFVNDRRPDAHERLVDRLLASPHYGERWGRHWLDVVRFAESNGFERDRIRRNFWPYRDYVIEAFNQDMPFDRFVIEQLAGDALDLNNLRYRIATGFLAAGPKNDVGTISPLEKLQTRQDELDDFVVSTSTTFLGLTVGCARCHDHKFDPIPTRDYYALTAVFSGCDHEPGVPISSPEERRRRDAQVKSLQEQMAPMRLRQQELLATARRQMLANKEQHKPDADSSNLPPVNARHNEDIFPPIQAKFVRFIINSTNRGQPCLDEVEVFGPGDDKNLALSSTGSKATASSLLPGYKIHQIHHLNDGKYGNSHSWISNEPGGWAQIELPTTTRINRIVWGRDRESKYTDRVPLAYRIEVSLDGKNWTRISDSTRRPSSANLSPDAPLSDKEVLASLTPGQRHVYDELERTIQVFQKQLNQLPPLPTTYALRDGAGDSTVPVLKRGNVREHGRRVSAGGLSAMRMLDRDLTADTGPQRRLKLARWIADPRNPLTARVLVNRVWHYHFGQGIVDTPSDFGFKGGAPSHPELLDWLASDFVANGWRIKRLHRQIVLSAAYRQGSEHHAAAAQLDAGNRLLWRYSPRRLDAEAIRDSILQLSGNLQRTLGGPSFELFAYRDGNVPDYQMVQEPGPETWRRSVYRYNIRTFHSPLMAAFDCPAPSVSAASRSQTTTPMQALSLLNNPFVVRQAESLAGRIGGAIGEEAQVVEAYRLILLREPTGTERERAVAFTREHGLGGLCRILLNCNEFLYVF